MTPRTIAAAAAADDEDEDASVVLRTLWKRAAVPVPAALLDADDARPPAVYPGYDEPLPATPPVLYLAYLAAPFAALLGGGDLGSGGALPYLLSSVAFVTLSAAVDVPQWPAAAASVVVAGSVTGSFEESGLAFALGMAVAALGALGNLEQDPEDAFGLDDDEGDGSSGSGGSGRLSGAAFEELDRLEVWDEQQQQRRRRRRSSSSSSSSSRRRSADDDDQQQQQQESSSGGNK